jgi:hypothetical protein
MTRFLFALLPAVALGCLANGGSRVGTPPTDRDWRLVRDALHAVAQPSFDKHVCGPDWTMRTAGHGSGGNSSETRWNVHFACLPTGEDPLTSQKIYLLPAEQYERVLTPVRADVLAALEATGVTLTGAGVMDCRGAPKPSGRFAISYLRKDGEIAGEVSGLLEPSLTDGQREGRFSDLTVTLREWYCH